MAIAIAAGVPTWLQKKLPSVEWKGETSASAEGTPVPEFQGLTGWFNTDEPVDPRTNGKVTLIDFWAYACINCQRNNEHITKIYDHYKDFGLEVVGIHAPEYAFEREAANVRKAAKEQGINYPVAQDNDFATWKAFDNHYWPAHYLVDSNGTVRETHHGEGDYAATERHIRELLLERDPGVALPEPLEGSDYTGASERNPETYLGTDRARYFDNNGYRPGTHDFELGDPKPGQYSLGGTWTLEDQPITAGDNARLRLNYHAAWVQLVVSGKGTVTLHRGNGDTEEFPVHEDGTIDLVKGEEMSETIELEVSEGLKLYSFTFG